jgi:hypothetical protein
MAMSIATIEGFARGFVDAPYPGSELGVAGLNGFYFGYGVGGPPVDNHLQYVMIAPGGPSIDLTPGADLGPLGAGPGRISLGYRDEDHDSSKDRYFYRTSHTMLSSNIARRYQVRDLGVVGSDTRPLPPELRAANPRLRKPVVAIAGFRMFFIGNRDHHIDRLAVTVNEDETYTVAFHDKKPDDVFAYAIDFVRIGGFLLDYRLREVSGSAKGYDIVDIGPDSGRDFVLRGFDFDFRYGDHHMREIGVLRVGSNLQVIYGDKNGDDRFDYTVKWAEVGTRLPDWATEVLPAAAMADA